MFVYLHVKVMEHICVLSEKERLTAWSQTNASEVERPRVWAARSVLELGATRSAHGRQLACRAHHPSYPSPYYRDSYTMLDVTCTYLFCLSLSNTLL